MHFWVPSSCPSRLLGSRTEDCCPPCSWSSHGLAMSGTGLPAVREVDLGGIMLTVVQADEICLWSSTHYVHFASKSLLVRNKTHILHNKLRGRPVVLVELFLRIPSTRPEAQGGLPSCYRPSKRSRVVVAKAVRIAGGCEVKVYNRRVCSLSCTPQRRGFDSLLCSLLLLCLSVQFAAVCRQLCLFGSLSPLLCVLNIWCIFRECRNLLGEHGTVRQNINPSSRVRVVLKDVAKAQVAYFLQAATS